MEPQFSQTYTFFTQTDDGVRLWVNGQLLIDKWIDQGPTEWSGSIALTSGQRYDILLEFYENGGGAMAKLSWSSASQPKQIIPQSRLYLPGSSSQVTFEWLVADHLGTPRMIFDKSGSLAATKRHDYLPFGEDLFAGVGGRTIALGYGGGDGVRQQFTAYERDNETDLDYAHARYYNSSAGRFTAADPLMASARPGARQTWNRYSYGLNNPMKYIDPSGLNAHDISTVEDQTREQQPPPPGGPVSPDPIKIDIGEPPPGLNDITVTATPGPTQFRVNVDTGVDGENRYFTGYFSLLTISFTDANGQPLTGTGSESLEGQGCGPDPTITQRDTPYKIENGQSHDLVGVGLSSATKVTDQAVIRNTLVTNANVACTQTTTQTATVIFPQGTYKVVFDRVFSNVDRNGRLQPVRVGPNREVFGNYSITVSKPIVTRVK